MSLDVHSLRSLFPITTRYIYLNHAGVGPCPLPVTGALTAMAELLASQPLDPMWDRLAEVVQENKDLGARLVGAERPDEMVFLAGTAMGINIAANGLPLDAGDNVIVLDRDYPATIYPWMNLAPRGIQTRFLPTPSGCMDLDALAHIIDSRTRVVCASTAMWTTGFRNPIVDLGRFCRERDLFFVLDAIQTLGVLPLDVREAQVDILAAGGPKWLLAGSGTGLLYVRREVLRRMRNGPYVGALSVTDPFNYEKLDFTLADTSDRFVLSGWPLPQIAALNAALRLLLETGIERIADHVLELTCVAAEDLQRRGYKIVSDMREDRRSGILIVSVPDLEAAYQRLTDAGICVSKRGGGIRISPHLYNTDDEVLQVGAVLDTGK